MTVELKQKERFKLICAVHLFLVRDGEILLLRRFNTGYHDGDYSVPAGHLDGNEKATAAMVREAKEETGIDVKPEDLTLVHFMHRKSSEERIDLFFTAKEWSGDPTITETNKCDDMKWFLMDKLPGNMVPYVKEAIKNYLVKDTYSEFGWIRQDLE